MFLKHYVNYQQDNWIEWLLVAYNNKKHTATVYISFKLNFRRYPWKRNLTIKMKLPKLNNFLKGLQRSWNKAKISIDIAKEAMKK